MNILIFIIINYPSKFSFFFFMPKKIALSYTPEKRNIIFY